MSLLVLGLAWAEPRFEVRATVSADLRTIRGTLRYDACACSFLDPLAELEVPPDDRTQMRTYPRGVDAGAVTFEVLPDGMLRFQARLPERYGDIGHVPGWGAYANGAWYPQPVDGAGHAVAGSWTGSVAVEGAPPATPEAPGCGSAPTSADVPVVVLNGVVGVGRAEGVFAADRLALAVVPDAVRTRMQVGVRCVEVVERRHAEPFVHRQLTTLLGLAPFVPSAVAPALPTSTRLTVVEDLDLRRLAVPAPGMVYLSDRTFRVTRPFASYHLGAVREALAAAVLDRADGWERAWLGAAVTQDLPLPSVEKLLGWLSWNPVVDQILHDGTLPFYSDVFVEAFPDPPGLVERLGDRIAPRAASLQLRELLGADGMTALALDALASGTPIPELAARRGAPTSLLDGWLRPYFPKQDYAVQVEGDVVTIERKAPEDAPPEVVGLIVDGAPVAPWLAPAGPGSTPLPGSPRRVVVDPAGHTLEADRVDNRWPPRWTTVLSGGIYEFSPSQGAFNLEGVAALRRLGDTRNLYLAGASHDVEDLASIWFAYIRYLGPLLDREFRSQRLVFSAGPSLLDPAYRPTADGAVAVGASVGFTEDTRQGELAWHGHRYSVSVGAGGVPGSPDAWVSAGAGTVQLVPVSTRFVVATRLGAGGASGEVEHRLLALGGASGLRSVSDHEVVGNERLIADLECRVSLFRNASIPLPLVWWTELQLAPGLEAGGLWRGDLAEFSPDRTDHAADPDGLYLGLGGTLGVHAVVDGFGARPVFVGGVLALPLWEAGFEPGGLQYYLDFGQSF